MILLLFVLGELSMIPVLAKWGIRGGMVFVAGELAVLTIAVMAGLVVLV